MKKKTLPIRVRHAYILSLSHTQSILQHKKLAFTNIFQHIVTFFYNQRNAQTMENIIFANLLQDSDAEVANRDNEWARQEVMNPKKSDKQHGAIQDFLALATCLHQTMLLPCVCAHTNNYSFIFLLVVYTHLLTRLMSSCIYTTISNAR